MKKFIFVLVILAITSSSSFGQLVLKSIPVSSFPGASLLIMEENTNYFSRDLIDVLWDNVSIKDRVKQKNNDFISIVIPENTLIGSHILKIILDDNLEGSLTFSVIDKPIYKSSDIDGHDPDPKTQLMKPKWLGNNPVGINRGQTVFNPSGGHNSSPVPCNLLHSIDGFFTDSIYNNTSEWESIIPLQGTFANLYLDYCDNQKILYLMNDWKLGKGNYDSLTCYNLFQFMTGNGSEKWFVKVWNAVSKGIVVYRNDIDVSNDTNFVVGGRYGFGDSPLEDSTHTMWEFGLKVSSGIYVMWLYKDEVGYYKIGDPSVVTKCDDDGYGLIQAPEYVTGSLGNGVTVTLDDRYIPINGVAGLVTEPNLFSGSLWQDSSSVRIVGADENLNKCSDNHVVDGEFSNDEWNQSNSAKGKYSNLYADYCNGTLYILNDWTLAKDEPYEKNCYNLFELNTGNNAQHWGIYVYHDTSKGIRVFLNGKDVSADSNIVIGGKFGFGRSLLEDTAHTIYEFGIRALEGNWHLFLCDPGPASFCDEDDSPAPRNAVNTIGIRKYSDNAISKPGDNESIIVVDEDKIFNLAFGSTDGVKELFSRKFKATINYNPKNFLPLSVEKSDKFKLGTDLTLSMKIVDNGILEIEGVSKDNFTASGDLFIIKSIISSNDASKTTISGDILFGNRSTYMWKSKLPEINFDILSLIKGETSKTNIADLALYPNPIYQKANNILTLSFLLLKDSKVSFELFNINGDRKEILKADYYSAGVHNIQYDISDLISGNYFIRLSTESGTRLTSFQIIR